MGKWKEYKALWLTGVVLLLFLAAAYAIVSRTEGKDSIYTYAEHLFQEGVVSEIDISIDEADWQDILENPLEEEYHLADITINGETIYNVAIRTKGNTSLTSVANSDSDRYSFKIDFDYYEDDGNYYGLRKLCLNNNYADPSNMREYIANKIMAAMGLPISGCGYAHITVNGEEWGLYLAVEPVDEVFLETRFDDATGDLYKPEGMGGTGADLVYRGDDISEYTGLNLKTNEDTSDGSEILALMRALEDGEGLEDVLDVDETLRYLAVNVALANFDSYLGGTTHNYYLYEENGYFTVIPWDLNLAFGGFGGGEVDIYEPTQSGMGGGPGGGDDRPEREETADAESTAETTAPEGMELPDGMELPEGMEFPDGMDFSSEKPLADTLLADETLLARYEEYLRELAETYLTEEYMTALVTEVHDLIAPYVAQDATAFYTYEEFEQSASTDPTDPYSLVYYAVNMSESILNQLNGGEPTFDTSSMKGGGMGMGGGMDFGGDMDFGDFGGFGADGASDDGTAPTQGEQPPDNGTAQTQGEQPPDNGTAPTQGEQPPDNNAAQMSSITVTEDGTAEEDTPPQTQGEPPAPPTETQGEAPQAQGDNAADGTQTDDAQGTPPAMPDGGNGGGQGGGSSGDGQGGRGQGGSPPSDFGGFGGMQQISIEEVLPMILLCCGIFVVGGVILVCFRRKKELKPPPMQPHDADGTQGNEPKTEIS